MVALRGKCRRSRAGQTRGSAPTLTPCGGDVICSSVPTPDPLHLFLSDLHLGRGTDAESRDAERDAIALLRAHEGAVRDAIEAGRGGGLFVVGDLFNQYIEYRSLVPKGGVRLQAELAAWTDGGLPVTYLVGNRDPWHLDYFERELGVRVLGEITVRLGDYHAYLAHGDGLVTSDRTYNLIKPVLRHPLAYRAYRTALPGDWGFRLARYVARRGECAADDAHDPGAPEPRFVDDLRDAARHRLATTEADLIVFGHTHAAELSRWPEGTFLNPGYWFGDRTFARLDDDGLGLLRWAGGEAELIVRPEPRAGHPY